MEIENCFVSLILKSQSLACVDGFFPESPVNRDFFFVDFLAVHFLDGGFSFLKVLILNEGIPFGITAFPVHVEMDALDLSKFAKGVINVILLALFVQVGDYDDPSFDS